MKLISFLKDIPTLGLAFWDFIIRPKRLSENIIGETSHGPPTFKTLLWCVTGSFLMFGLHSAISGHSILGNLGISFSKENDVEIIRQDFPVVEYLTPDFHGVTKPVILVPQTLKVIDLRTDTAKASFSRFSWFERAGLNFNVQTDQSLYEPARDQITIYPNEIGFGFGLANILFINTNPCSIIGAEIFTVLILVYSLVSSVSLYLSICLVSRKISFEKVFRLNILYFSFSLLLLSGVTIALFISLGNILGERKELLGTLFNVGFTLCMLLLLRSYIGLISKALPLSRRRKIIAAILFVVILSFAGPFLAMPGIWVAICFGDLWVTIL